MSGLLKDLLRDWHDAWVSMLPIQEHGFIREHLEMLFVCAMVGSLTCFLQPVFVARHFLLNCSCGSYPSFQHKGHHCNIAY